MGGAPIASAPFAPAALDVVLATIAREHPAIVFSAHVETSSGILLPPEYIASVADAVHAVGGIFVLDCIASGALFVNCSSSTCRSPRWTLSWRLRSHIPGQRAEALYCSVDGLRWISTLHRPQSWRRHPSRSTSSSGAP